MRDYLRVAGKAAIVTGSGRGIGRGVAMELASYGVKVMVTDINDENGLRVKDEILAAGGTAEYCHCDVMKVEDIKNLVQKTVEAFGTVDILVNDAAWQLNKPLLETTQADWDRVLAVNLTGPFRRAAETDGLFSEPHRRAGGGGQFSQGGRLTAGILWLKQS